MTDWATVLSEDYAVPPDLSAVELTDLVDELCDMIGSPDPRVRDDTAYPILAIWTARGVLDGRLAGLGDRMAARLRHDRVDARTFAAMILGWVVLRDARTAELDAARVPRWRTAFVDWWLAEPDLRGWDAELGWLHAVAHGADALRAFARSPRLGAADLRALLEVAVDRLFADGGYLYAHGEDDRVAYALASALSRPELTEAQATGWLERVHAAIADGEPGPVPAWASNTLRTLSACYVFADRGVRWYDPDAGAMGDVAPLPHAAAVKERIAPILALVWAGLG
jgi:hypothetical protein